MRPMLQLAAFGAALREERERQGYSLANLAKYLGGVCKDDIRDWEAGYVAPGKIDLKQLVTCMPRLGRFEADLKCGNFQAEERPARAQQASPIALALAATVQPVPGAPAVLKFAIHADAARGAATFGAALAAVRKMHSITQDGLAELCDVTASAVGHWEQDLWSPVRENYDKLLDLFPELHEAPKPTARDIDVPVGAAGYERVVVRSVPVEPTPEPPARVTSDEPPPNPQPDPEIEAAPMPDPVSPPSLVALPAIVRWTNATAALQLDTAQSAALGELLKAGAELGLDVASVATVLSQWPQRAKPAMQAR